MDVLQFILNFTLSDLETSILPRDLAFWPACPPAAAFRIGSSFSPDSTLKPFLVHLSLSMAYPSVVPVSPQAMQPAPHSIQGKSFQANLSSLLFPELN